MNAVVKIDGKPSLIATMAQKYGIDPDKMLITLKATAFRGDVSTEQMMALCIVANQYGLNPWTKEIYAFPDRNNGIVPVVGVDGWSRITNDHPQCNGVQFTEADDASWCECTIHRKDRQYPTTIREYMAEVKRDTGPWKSHPRRMLRHKAMIQCARIVFGFAGIYDPDEAERIVESTPLQISASVGLETADPERVDALVSEVTDVLAQDVEEDVRADGIFAIHQKVYNDASTYNALQDALKARGIIKAAGWKSLVAMGSKQYQDNAGRVA